MQPRGLALDIANPDLLYIADGGNHLIRVLSLQPTCFITTLAGSGAGQYADGLGTAASFWTPQGITQDANGFLFIGDSVNQRLRRVSLQDFRWQVGVQILQSALTGDMRITWRRAEI